MYSDDNNKKPSRECELEFLAPSYMRNNKTKLTHKESKSDSDSNSDDEIKLEITDIIKGKERTKTIIIQQNSTKKRLLCFSVINNENCNYGNYCTFAHTLSEQVIDAEMLYIYQIILDKDLMNFFSLSNPKMDDIYKKLLFFTYVCPKCVSNTCMGGYNCKYGTHDPCLKICKNDLLTGECINKLINIPINNSILDKIELINKKETPFSPTGCINGHHLSERNLIPYYKYINDKNISKKTVHQSVRYINANPICNILKNKNCVYGNHKSSETSDSTDEEINEWFRKDSYSSDDIDL